MISKGSIRKRIEDANFNICHERYEAALALLLIAVDGSARKVYPKGTKSLENPKREMGNKERYTRFLGIRLRQLMGIEIDDEAYFKGVLMKFVEGAESPEDTIYTNFRCNELHESGLPDHLTYAYDSKGVNNQFSLEFHNGEVHFSSGFLRLLESAVVGAPCNGDEFAINHYRLIPTGGEDLQSFIDRFSHRYSISPGRVRILRNLIQFIGPEAGCMNDEKLSFSLTEMLDTKMVGGARTGLCMTMTVEPICLQNGGFTRFGVEIVRDMLSNANLVNLTVIQPT